MDIKLWADLWKLAINLRSSKEIEVGVDHHPSKGKGIIEEVLSLDEGKGTRHHDLIVVMKDIIKSAKHKDVRGHHLAVAQDTRIQVDSSHSEIYLINKKNKLKQNIFGVLGFWD